jgi:hypothetical protein
MATQNKGSINTSKVSQNPKPATVGREKSFDSNKYKVDNLSYPSDLFSNQGSSTSRGGGSEFFNQSYVNYVVFYVNVSDQSRVFTEAKVEIVGDIDNTSQNRTTGKQASLGTATASAGESGLLVGGAVGVAEGASGNAKVLGTGKGATATFLKGVGGTAAARGIQGGVGTAAALGGMGKLLENNPGSAGLKPSQKTKRLKTAIALHVPNEVSVGYKAQWGEEELGAIFGAAAEAATGGGGAGQQGMNGAVAKGLEVTPARAALSSLYKMAANPRKEQLFKSMEFRRFSFNYQFAPRSAAEANNVKRIINMFKFHMHPEFQNNVNKMLYLFPSEFDIVYYFGDKEHPHLNRISTCVLTDLNINYSPNGQFSTFKDGFPTQINVQMQFLELETLTKERFLGEGPDGKVQFSNQDFQNPDLPSF